MSCSLKSVSIGNSVTSIGEEAFYSCSDLTDVTIPNNVKSIGWGAFGHCTGMKSVVIGDGITFINESAFYNCKRLESVTIGKSVKSIGSQAFYNCKGLTSVTIPDCVTSIGSKAFNYCDGLTTISIGKNVTSIGQGAFEKCSELKDVYCFAEKVPSTSSDVFKDCYIDYETLHVPEESIGKYKARDPWNQFGEIVPLTKRETGITTLKSDDAKLVEGIFTPDGRRVDTLQKGVNIIRYTNGRVNKMFMK